MATFDVDVGGVTYEVDAPDENTAWKWANKTHTSQPQKTQQDFLRESLQEMPWLQRQAVAAGGQLVKGYQGLKELAGGTADKDVLSAANIAAEKAPVGAFAGEVARFAPAALAGTAVLPAMGASAAIGALTTPGGIDERAESAAFEGGFAGLGGLIGKGIARGAMVAPRMFDGGLSSARKALRELMGEANIPEVQRALETTRPGVTTAQALTEAGVISPTRGQTLAAGLDQFSQQLDTIPGAREAADYWGGVAPRQEAAQLAELERLAGGSSAEQTAALRSQMLSDLESKLRPLRETQLGRANVGREAIEPMLQRAARLEQEALTFGGTSAEAGKLRDTVAFLQKEGFQPLDVNPIIGRVQSVLDDPELGASVNVSDVMSRVGGLVNEWVKRGGGTIDANALYQIRKSGVNEAIDRLLASADPVVSKKLAAKLSSEIRPLIDDAIEQAGAPGWRQYISQYGEGLEKIDRQELLDTVRQLFKSEGGKQAFMDLVKGESPEVVQKIMSGKRGIADALPPETLARLEDIANQVQRDVTLEKAANIPQAKQAAERILKDASFVGKLPNLLNRWMVLANVAIKKGEMVMNKKMYTLLDKAARDPAAMRELISKMPTSQQEEMMKEIAKMGVKPGAVVGAAIAGTGE